MSADRRLVKHGPTLHEEDLPQSPCRLEGRRPEPLQTEALPLQRLGRAPNSCSGFGRDRDQPVVLKPANRDLSGFSEAPFPIHPRQTSGACVGRPRCDTKHQFHVRNRARHRADRAQGGERPDAGRQMSLGRDAPRCGLQRAYSREVSRFPHRASAIAAETSRRETGCDRRSLPSARASRRPFERPRVVGSAVQQIIGLVRHQKLGTVCRPQDHGALMPQLCDACSVGCGYVSAVQDAANLTSVPCRRDGRLDRHGQPLKFTAGIPHAPAHGLARGRNQRSRSGSGLVFRSDRCALPPAPARRSGAFAASGAAPLPAGGRRSRPTLAPAGDGMHPVFRKVALRRLAHVTSIESTLHAIQLPPCPPPPCVACASTRSVKCNQS